MDDRILYNPDNRFLASSGSNDFSLYGAPADPALWFARAAAPSEDDEAAPSAGSGPAPLEPGPGQTAASLPSALQGIAPPAGDGAAPVPASVLPAAAFAEAAPSAAPVTPLAPFVPGFAAPPSVERSEAAPPQAPAAAPEARADAAPASGEGLTGTTQAAAATVPAASLAPEASSIGPAVSGPLSQLLPAGTSVPEDGVNDLLGSDPAGGIATLVSLVTISEVLDLQPAGGEGGNPVIAAGAPVIDTLATDALGETAPPDSEADAPDPVAGIITVPLPLPDDGLPGGLG